MTDEKWNELIERAKQKFADVSAYTEDLLVATGEGEQKQGTRDVLEFSTPLGNFRIVRENKPVLLEKKMHFSHRQGQAAHSEYLFSDTEFTHKVFIYKEDPRSGEFDKVDPENIGFLF